MPGIIDALRARYPEFKDYSDQQLAEAAAPAFGGSLDESAKFLGIERNEPGFKTGLKTGLSSYAVGAGRALEDMGAEGVGGGLRRYGEDVQFRNPTTVNSFEEFGAHPWQGIKELAGQAIGSSAPAMIPYVGPVSRGLGLAGTTAAGAALASVPAYGQIRQTQDQTGYQNIPAAIGGALATGAIEQLGGIQRVFRPGQAANLLAEAGRTPLRTFGKTTLRTGMEEGLEELAQNPIQQLAGGQDPLEQQQLMDTAFQGFGGFVGGVPLGLAGGAHLGMQHRGALNFIASNLNDPQAPVDARMQAIQMQHTLMGGGPDANVWASQMRDVVQRDQDQMRAQQLASGAPFNLLDLQRDLNLTAQPVPSGEPTGSIMDTINQNQGAVQALPHAGQGMAPGTPVEPPVNRAASIYAALSGQNNQPGSQEAVDLDWARQQLQQSMSPQAFADFEGQLALERLAGQRPKREVKAAVPNAAPQGRASGSTQVPGGQAPAAAPQTLGAKFKAAGGRVTNVAKALDAAKSPEDAVEIVRQGIEKPNIASSTLRALEELHKQLTGITYEQHLHQQEAADVRQGGSSETVPAGNGQAQGAQPGTAVQPAGAAGQRPAQPNRQGSGKVAVSDSAKRAQLAERIIGSLKPEDQEILGFLQQHGEKAFQRLGDKWGITRQAARDRVMGKRDREGNVKQVGIVDKISNIAARHGLTVDDLLAGFKPRVYESTEARTGLSPSVNESVHQEEALADESPTEQGTGTVASPGGSQSDWRESARDRQLAKDVPGYAEKMAAEQHEPAAESAQEHIPAAQGEKVDQRVEGRQAAQTSYERANDWWETERDNDPHVPKFEDLADRHQEEVVQAVEKGEANGRLQKRVIAEFNEPSYYNRGRALREDEWRGTNGAFARVRSALKDSGTASIWNFVHKVVVQDGLSGFGRFIPHEDRTFTVVLQKALVEAADTDPDMAADLTHTMLHELAHGIDHVSPVSMSAQPAIAVQWNGDGKPVTPLGDVAKELFALWQKRANVGRFLDYPFDPKYGGKMGIKEAFQVQMEIWAQLQAFWMNRIGRKMLQRDAPLAAQFLREANDYLRPQLDTLGEKQAQANQPAPGRELRPAANEQGRGARSDQAGANAAAGSAASEEVNNRGQSIERIERAQTEASTRIADAWAKVKPTILTLHQLVDQFGDKLQTLKDYVLSMDKMEQRHHEILNRAHKVILDWQKIPTRTRQQLDQVMQRATMRGVHPDEAFGTGPNAHLTEQAEYDSLKSAYDALPADAKATYKAVRKLLDDNWTARKAAFSRSTTHAYDKLIEAATGDQKKVDELTKERDQLIRDHDKAISDLKGPYFPLLRFGDYLTIAKSAEYAKVEKDLEDATGSERTALQKQLQGMQKQQQHYAVEAHANRYEAESSASRYTARGMQARTQLAEEHLRALQPIAAGAIDRISSALSDQFDRPTAAKLKQAITEVYISSLPEHAALQRQLKRKGVEGATTDMLRAVAKTVEKDGFYLARLEYADEIADGLFKLKTEAKKAGIDYQHVYNNLAARMALDFEYKPTPVQNFLARLSGIWHLGMSPAYLLTNSTQPWMITAPVLAGRFGAARTFAALRSAWVDAARIIKQSKSGGAFADIDFKSVTDAQERDMLERIVQRGQIDITQNVDMGLVADGVDPKFLKLTKVFNWANQHIEVSNRITTALAAYRLGRQRGMDQEAAADFAYKAVVDTQLDYSNANAAYWMKSGAVPLGKLIFQFRKYQQGMLYLMGRNAQLAFKGDKDALRSLGYLAAMQLLFAGAAGIPVVMAPLAALKFFWPKDDEKGDPETQLRNYLADLMGQDAARAFWKGLPTLMGLDVSQRVGMGDFWNPLPYLRLTGKTGSDDMGQLLLQTLGAPFGTLASGWDAMKFFEKGDWGKGIEKLLPKMLADPLKASRYAGEGITTRSGNQVLSPEKIDGWDIAFRAAGFQPTVESEHYAAQSSKESVTTAIKERRDNVLAKYAQTKLGGGDTGSALDAINAFNQEHPQQRVDRSAMLKAVQSRKKGGAELDEAGVRFGKKDRPLRGIDRYAYGA